MPHFEGVFGVRGCYYLVSVSEDAMSGFEQRGLPFRDVFDSSFDAIERVGYLSFAETQSVLDRRVVGLPVPFQVLCHSLSGGLPRDLIRVARELVHQDRILADYRRSRREPDRRTSLKELVEATVRAELEGKVAAALISVRGVPAEAQREWLLAWLSEGAASSSEPTALRERCARLA